MYVIVHVLVNLSYGTNITCMCSLIYILLFYVIMLFFKNVPMGAQDSTMGNPLIVNALIEILRNGQGKNIIEMVHEVSLKIVFK